MESSQEVGQRRGVFVGVSAIGIEEASAVGAQVLDNLQCYDRSLRDYL
jgi:hypothetical protein